MFNSSYRAINITASNLFARKVRNGSTYGGKRGVKRYAGEMARRVRQIEHGQLTPSNGLVSEWTSNIKVNSHGSIHTSCKPCQAQLSTPDGPGECDFPNCADIRRNGCAV